MRHVSLGAAALVAAACLPLAGCPGRGKDAGSIFTTGPTMTICQSGRVDAIPASSERSIRSSITPK